MRFVKKSARKYIGLLSHIQSIYIHIMATCLFWSVSALTFADGVIPISQEDQTSSGNDFGHTFLVMLKDVFIPMVEYGGATILIFMAISGLWRGHKEAQDKREGGPFKEAIVHAVLLVVVGGSLFWLLDYVRNKIPA